MNAKILIADDESDIVSMLGSFFLKARAFVSCLLPMVQKH